MDEDGKTWRKMERHEGRRKDIGDNGKTRIDRGRCKKTMLERENVDTNHGISD